MNRGEFTGKINTIARSRKHVRLVPYIHYLACNGCRIDPNKINHDERQIVSEWRNAGYMEGGASEMVRVSKEFWDMMNQVLWVNYAHKIQDDES